ELSSRVCTGTTSSSRCRRLPRRIPVQSTRSSHCRQQRRQIHLHHVGHNFQRGRSQKSRGVKLWSRERSEFVTIRRRNELNAVYRARKWPEKSDLNTQEV